MLFVLFRVGVALPQASGRCVARRSFGHIPHGESTHVEPLTSLLNEGKHRHPHQHGKSQGALADGSGNAEPFRRHKEVHDRHDASLHDAGLLSSRDPTKQSADHYQFKRPEYRADIDGDGTGTLPTFIVQPLRSVYLRLVKRFGTTRGTQDFNKMSFDPRDQEKIHRSYFSLIELSTLVRVSSSWKRSPGKAFTDHANPSIRSLHPKESAMASKMLNDAGMGRGSVVYVVVTMSVGFFFMILLVVLSGSTGSKRYAEKLAALEALEKELAAKQESCSKELKAVDELLEQSKKQTQSTVQLADEMRQLMRDAVINTVAPVPSSD